jgi:predicted glycosyltransferase
MKVLMTIQHPAHVHFFKNIIAELEVAGHDLAIAVRKGEHIERLLDTYDINHTILAGQANTLPELMKIQMKYEYNIFKKAKSFEPDALAAIGEPSIAHVGKYLGIPSLIFTDTEHAKLQNKITFPFADTIYTPEAYTENIGQKQIRYPGYHELAYLHPNHFTPDPTVFEDTRLTPDACFAVVRVVSGNAAHDIRKDGLVNIEEYIDRIERTGTEVVLSFEAGVPEKFVDYQVTVPPHRIHHLMYYADLFIGDSGTMAIESAVLGTPSVYTSPLSAGVFSELNRSYKLLFNYHDDKRYKEGLEKGLSLLEVPDTVWKKRRMDLIDDKIEVSKYVTTEIEKSANEF